MFNSWTKLEFEAPKKNKKYLVYFSKTESFDIAKWKDYYFDLNPQDIPYYNPEQPTHWKHLIPPKD